LLFRIDVHKLYYVKIDLILIKILKTQNLLFYKPILKLKIMKKVILLLVAVMIASVSFAQTNGFANGHHGKKHHRMDGNDAAITQVGLWNKAYVDQTQAKKSLATITLYGVGNDASIKQVGYGNVAGGKIQAHTNPCDGFCAFVEPSYFPAAGGVCMSSVDLACCGEIPGKYYSFDLAPLFPGIFAVGENNTATISQDGAFLVAGIIVMGEDNEVGIKQKGLGNMAAIWVDGKDNHAVIKQGRHSAFNYASAKVTGKDNVTFASQDGYFNVSVQDVSGKDNEAYIQQDGVGNVAYQKVCGRDNTVLANQWGWGNKSVQMTGGSGNTSLVNQFGMKNQATIVQ
jgi:hypothetical protein